MKIFIVFLVLFLSAFSEGRNFLGDISKVFFPAKIITKDAAPPTALVGINVTWTFNSAINTTNVVMIVHKLATAEWAAVGLGQKVAMGEAHVFMCKRLANDTIVINRYANSGSPDDHNPPAPAGIEDGGLFTPLASELKDGIVTCQFTLSNFTSSTVKQPNTLDPLSQSRTYHPLFAVGLLNEDNTPHQHDLLSHEPRLSTFQLNQNVNVLYRL